MVHNEKQTHSIPLFSLLPAVREEQHLTREHILLGDSVDVQSVYSGLPSTHSFWLYYSLLSKTQGMNKCIIGVICLGGWVKRSVYSWLHHSVSAPVSDRRSSTSRKEKTECWNNPIWFTYGRHAAITISWQLLSVEYVADWQQLRKNTQGAVRMPLCLSLFLSAPWSAIKDKMFAFWTHRLQCLT